MTLKAGDIIMFVDQYIVNDLDDVSIKKEYRMFEDEDGELFFIDDAKEANWSADAAGDSNGQFIIIKQGE